MYKKGMLHKESFQNKVILITGGGSGLGKSIGKYLLELGASIIITSRKMEVLQKTTDEFNKDLSSKAEEWGYNTAQKCTEKMGLDFSNGLMKNFY